MDGSVLLKKEARERRLQMEVVRVDEEQRKALCELLEALRLALRNPKRSENSDRFGELARAMLGKDGRRMFELLDKEIMKGTGKLRKEEVDAFFTYASVGRPDDRIDSLLGLLRDVEKCREALATVDGRMGRASPAGISRLLDASEKGELDSKEVMAALGTRDQELAEAMRILLSRQEAASVAARNRLGLGQEDYEKLLGIGARNAAAALLRLYSRVLADPKFAKAREAASRGDAAAVFAEVQKAGLAAQYVFLALMAPGLVRSGMWNPGALGILGRALAAAARAARKAGADPAGAQMECLAAARGFISRFGDVKGLNLALFSAAYAASRK